MEDIEITVSPAVTERFRGELVAQAKTSGLRWVAIDLYRVEDGGWLVHRMGCSSVYHAEPTPCRTGSDRTPGVVGTVDDLPDEAEPCEHCTPPPPLDLDDHQAVRFEETRHTVTRYETAREVIHGLTHFRDRGRPVVRMSAPVADLMRQAASKDQEFASITAA